MSLIEQIDRLEKSLADLLKPTLESKDLKGTSIYCGWGGSERTEDGSHRPILKTSPSIEIVANESTPGDEGDLRTITLRITLESCQDDGVSIHRSREKALDPILCEIDQEEIDAVDRIRWSLSRLNGDEGQYMTEWNAEISVPDPCFVC